MKTETKMTHDELAAMNPCSDGMAYARSHKTLKAAWDKCERPDWMIWYLRRKSLLDKPMAVKFAILCAKRVLSIYEKKNPNDNRPRAAIEAAEKWLKEPTEDNRKAAAAAAYAAADAYYAAAAYAAAYAAAAAYYAAYAAYAGDAGDAGDASAGDAARKSERKWQANQLRKLVKNPFI